MKAEALVYSYDSRSWGFKKINIYSKTRDEIMRVGHTDVSASEVVSKNYEHVKTAIIMAT